LFLGKTGGKDRKAAPSTKDKDKGGKEGRQVGGVTNPNHKDKVKTDSWEAKEWESNNGPGSTFDLENGWTERCYAGDKLEADANKEKAVADDAKETISLGGGGNPKSPNDDGKPDDKGNNDDAIGTSLGMMGGGGGEDALLKAGAMLLVVGGATSETGIGLGIAATALAMLAADQVIKKTKALIDEKYKDKIFVLYQKEKILKDGTKLIYIGRSSGFGSPTDIVRKRDFGHHMKAKGYGDAVLLQEYTTNSYSAIRGSEQALINRYFNLGIGGNAINGISPNNKNKSVYIESAVEAFGSELRDLLDDASWMK